jgi:hypothetical protein
MRASPIAFDEMVHRQSRDQTVKLRRVERQVLCVAPPELNIAQSGLRASGLGFFEHLFGGIERHHGYRAGRDCGRDDPGSASHIEDLSAPCTSEHGSSSEDADESNLQNAIERLPDPSHVRMLPASESVRTVVRALAEAGRTAGMGLCIKDAQVVFFHCWRLVKAVKPFGH